jgi:hypothetical protein
MDTFTAGTSLACTGSISFRCDGRDVQLRVAGLGHEPRPTCAACAAAAEALGLPLRVWVPRDSDRRRNRVAFPGEGFGRRVADAVLAARRSPMH